MRRIVITLGYVGSGYDGWQIQPDRDTVQSRVEDAVFALTGVKTSVVASGRTDAGVHAIGQVAHFDTPVSIPAKNFVKGLNRFLPPDIRVTKAEERDENFHARFSAHEKTYRYIVYACSAESALLAGRVWRVDYPLDADRMREAAAYLVGEHDFTSFMSTGADTKTAVRNVKSITITRRGKEIRLTFTANGFLYNMVRLMTGAIVKAGSGKIAPEAIKDMLEARSKTAVTFVAPADGLYLVKVKYPPLSRK